MYVLYALSLLQVYISRIFHFCRLHILNSRSDHCTIRIQWVPRLSQVKLLQMAADSRNARALNPTKVYASIDLHPCVPVDLVCIYIVSFVSFNLFLRTESAYPSHGSFLAAIHLQMWIMLQCVCIASSLVSIQYTCMRGMCECRHCIMHFDDHQHLVTLLKLFHHFKVYYYSNFLCSTRYWVLGKQVIYHCYSVTYNSVCNRCFIMSSVSSVHNSMLTCSCCAVTSANLFTESARLS